MLVKTLVHWSKKPTWPSFWLHSLETGPKCLSWLFISMHIWIYQTQDLFFCLPDFQLCVSGTENRQVSRSQTCCSTCHYFNTAGTGEEHNRGKFVHQSEQRLNYMRPFQPIRVHHLHDLSHTCIYHWGLCTMLCMCSFGCINTWQFCFMVVLLRLPTEETFVIWAI